MGGFLYPRPARQEKHFGGKAACSATEADDTVSVKRVIITFKGSLCAGLC